MPNGPSAARGAWSADGTSLVLEVQTLGNDDVARVTHVFGDKTVEVSVEGANGFRAKAAGTGGRLRMAGEKADNCHRPG